MAPTCATSDQSAKRRSAILLFLPAAVCTVHTVNSADLIKLLEKAGWVLRNVKGSHHVYSHPRRGGRISVPHPRKDLGAGLVHTLLKQAGLK